MLFFDVSKHILKMFTSVAKNKSKKSLKPLKKHAVKLKYEVKWPF